MHVSYFRRETSALYVHMSNLQSLEVCVQHSRFIASVREGLDLSTYSREDSDPTARCTELEVRDTD